MPSFETPLRKLLRTDKDLQLWKSRVGKFIRADGTMSGQSGTTIVMQATNWKWPPAVALTLASDAVTLTQSHHTIDTEAAAATDNLATVNGLVANEFYLLRPANDARTIVVKHGTGNIKCEGNVDLTLDDIHDYILGFSPDGVTMYAMFGASVLGASNIRELLFFAATPALGDNQAYIPWRLNGTAGTMLSLAARARDWGNGTTTIDLLKAAHSLTAIPLVFVSVLSTKLTIESSHIALGGVESLTMTTPVFSPSSIAHDDILRQDFIAVADAINVSTVLTASAP